MRHDLRISNRAAGIEELRSEDSAFDLVKFALFYMVTEFGRSFRRRRVYGTRGGLDASRQKKGGKD